MLTFVVAVLAIWVFVKLIVLAIKAAWGITKILAAFLLLPLVLVGLAVSGLLVLAVPLLAAVGLVALIGGHP